MKVFRALRLAAAFSGFAAAAVSAAAQASAQASSAGDDAPLPVDALVATVNGDTVSISDVMREIQPALAAARREHGGEDGGEAAFRAAFRETLDSIIDRRLVVQKYWAGEQRLPPHAIDRTTAEILEDRYGGNIQNLLADLAEDRMTYAEWRDRMQERLIVASMRHGFADGSAHVSPSEIAAAYEARKGEFARPARAELRLAAFAGDCAAEAAEAAVASCRAEGAAAAFDALAESGGPGVSVQDLGFVNPAEDLAPALADAAASVGDGEASAPVSVGDSVFVLYKVRSDSSGSKPLSEAWDEIRSGLLAEKKAAAFKNWIRHLRADAVIVENLPF